MLASSMNISIDEYLRSEECSAVRNEFVDGKVYAMSDSTDSHSCISGNIFSLLHTHFRGSGWRTYTSAMKVRIESANCFYYPDVIVSCEPFQPKSVFKLAPSLIVEVLSPSTAQIDMREKLIAYKLIESLAEYLIVYQDQQKVELHRRINGKSWSVRVIGPFEDIVLGASTGKPITISFAEIYDETDAV